MSQIEEREEEKRIRASFWFLCDVDRRAGGVIECMQGGRERDRERERAKRGSLGIRLALCASS
jgi:hypothetical protein